MSFYWRILGLIFLFFFILSFSCCTIENQTLKSVSLNEQKKWVLDFPIPKSIQIKLAQKILHNTNFTGLQNPCLHYEIILYEIKKHKKKKGNLLFQKGYRYDFWSRSYFIEQKINRQYFFNDKQKKLFSNQNLSATFFPDQQLKIIALEKNFTNALTALFKIDDLALFPIDFLQTTTSRYQIVSKVTFFKKDISSTANIWEKIILFLIREQFIYKTKSFHIVDQKIKI